MMQIFGQNNAKCLLASEGFPKKKKISHTNTHTVHICAIITTCYVYIKRQTDHLSFHIIFLNY